MCKIRWNFQFSCKKKSSTAALNLFIYIISCFHLCSFDLISHSPFPLLPFSSSSLIFLFCLFFSPTLFSPTVSSSFIALLSFPFLCFFLPFLVLSSPLPSASSHPRQTHQMKLFHCFRCKFGPESELNKRLPLYNITAIITDSFKHNRRNVSFYWDTIALWQLLSPSSSPTPFPSWNKNPH